MSTSGGVWKAIKRGLEIQCDIIQVFVKNNMQWFGKAHSPADLSLFAAERASPKLAAVFGHTGYLINLGAPPSENRDKSLRSLIQEIELATALGIPFLVMHPGAHLGQGEKKGIIQILRGLNEVFRATAKSPVRIALEVTAGQGTCLGYRLEHLSEIYQRAKKPERLAVCLDTAHLFAAGYDIRTRAGWDKTMQQLTSLIPVSEVVAMHLNDSKTALGSRVDRHEHIGQGQIGREAFRHIVKEPQLTGVPGCLETPKSADLHEDIMNLAVLRELYGGSLASSRAGVRAILPAKLRLARVRR